MKVISWLMLSSIVNKEEWGNKTELDSHDTASQGNFLFFSIFFLGQSLLFKTSTYCNLRKKKIIIIIIIIRIK